MPSTRLMPKTCSPERIRSLLSLCLAAFLVFAACGSGPVSDGGPLPAPDTANASPAATSQGGQGQAPATPADTATSEVPATPRATLPRVPPLQPPAYASRVVVPAYDIDLPVVSGDLQPPPAFPYCDVAAYVTLFSQPYEAGVTYLSAHAQRDMFLPLLEASRRQDGRELVGERVDVYTNDGMRYEYRLEQVIRHATDYSFLNQISLSDRHVVLQTSEGPYGTTEKLQVVGVYVGKEAVDVAEATPTAFPRDCRPPELIESPQP
jgi:hypothetical protein